MGQNPLNIIRIKKSVQKNGPSLNGTNVAPPCMSYLDLIVSCSADTLSFPKEKLLTIVSRAAKNTSFTIFVIVIPKEGLICSIHRLHEKTPKEGLAPPVNPPFGMKTTKILKDPFLQHTTQLQDIPVAYYLHQESLTESQVI